MKTLYRFALIIFLFICSAKLSAQDTLILTNGTIISAKIIEVSSDEIKYKRFENMDGPLFIAKTSEISAIKYKGGIVDLLNKPKTPVVAAPVDPYPRIERLGAYYRQGYTRMREGEMQSILKSLNDNQINYHIQKARLSRGMQNIGFVAIPAFAFTLGYSIYALIHNNNRPINNYNGTGPNPYSVDYTPAIITGVVAAAAITASITFGVLRKNHNAAALKIYNEKY